MVRPTSSTQIDSYVNDAAAPDISALQQAKARLILVIAFFMMCFFAVTLRLTDLTLLQARSETAVVEKETAIPLKKPLRGIITDRHGELMATSLKMASVYVDPSMVDNPEALADDILKILPGQKKDDLVKKLSSGKKFIWLQRDITPKQEYALNALGNPAINFQEEERRIYPSGNLSAHLLGYTDVDGHGIAGIEKKFDAALLKGDTPVKLSVDLRLQHIMHRELSEAVRKFKASGAIGMITDVNTGEVLSMVSLPDFDPHHPGAAPDQARFNRATLGVFEMGSTFKLFSTAAALDSGHINFNSSYDARVPIKYGRFTISDYHAKNRVMTVPEIFIYSSNIGTARMAMETGTKALHDFYQKIGFFESAPLEISERGSPLYPKPWRDISTMTTSFGHGIAVSPVHLVRAASALVNGGILITPTLVAKDSPTDALTPVGDRVVKPETSIKIRQLMELVVAGGTGGNAKVEGYSVGGKTGTSEKNINGRYVANAVMSSFIGVYPMDNPRYAVLAIIDDPNPIPETHGYVTGGWTAAPVVGRVIEQMAPLYQIAPNLDTSHDIVKTMSAYVKEFREGKAVAAAGNDH